MKLSLKTIEDSEIVHHFDTKLSITSKHNTISVKRNLSSYTISLPRTLLDKVFGKSRLLRRLLRLDKCNVLSVDNGLVIIRQGDVYHWNNKNKILTKTIVLKNCRNILHNSMAKIPNGSIFFGEYGSNKTRREVPIYRSDDHGKSWITIFKFPSHKIKHVHGCYYDKYENKIWTVTGDLDGECHILISDFDFKNIEWIGDGSQLFRTCSLFFEQDKVHWLTDSNHNQNYHVFLDRKTRKVYRGQPIPGPVWYSKNINNLFVAATAQEKGKGVQDRSVHFLVSTNLIEWKSVYQFEHDGLPKGYFKFGVIGFSEGQQSPHHFPIFLEAIKGFDGKTVYCALHDNK